MSSVVEGRGGGGVEFLVGAGEGVAGGGEELVAGDAELDGVDGAEVEEGGGGGGDGIDGGAAGDVACGEGGAGAVGEGEFGEFTEDAGKEKDGVGRAGVGPGVAAGAGDGEAETEAAEGVGDDGGGAGALEDEDAGDAAGERAAGEQVAHAAEIAFAFFADVCGEDDGDGRSDVGEAEGSGEAEQGGEAGAVVAGAWGVEAGAIFARGAGGAGGEDGVEVGGDEEDGLAGMRGVGGEFSESVAGVVEADVRETERLEEGDDGVGAGALAEGRRGDGDEVEEPLAELGLVEMQPVEGAMDGGRGGEGEDASLGAGNGVGGVGWGWVAEVHCWSFRGSASTRRGSALASTGL